MSLSMLTSRFHCLELTRRLPTRRDQLGLVSMLASDISDITLYSARGSALECYICAEGPPACKDKLLSVCQCQGRYIHLACQQRLVDRVHGHSLHCSVCKARYNNIESEHVERVFTWEGKIFIAMVVFVLILTGLSLHQLVGAFLQVREASTSSLLNLAALSSYTPPLASLVQSGRHGIFMFVAGCFFALVVIFAASFLHQMRPKVIWHWSRTGIKLHDRPVETEKGAETQTAPVTPAPPLPPPLHQATNSMVVPYAFGQVASVLAFGQVAIPPSGLQLHELSA